MEILLLRSNLQRCRPLLLALLPVLAAMPLVPRPPSKSTRSATPVLMRAGLAKEFGAGSSTSAVSAKAHMLWWTAMSDARPHLQVSPRPAWLVCLSLLSNLSLLLYRPRPFVRLLRLFIPKFLVFPKPASSGSPRALLHKWMASP